MVAEREHHARRHGRFEVGPAPFVVERLRREPEQREALAELLDRAVAERLPVDRQLPIDDRDVIAADRDDALDEARRAVLGRVEQGDVASPRGRRTEEIDRRQRNSQTVCHLVDDDAATASSMIVCAPARYSGFHMKPSPLR
jgi:hypothetical protein